MTTPVLALYGLSRGWLEAYRRWRQRARDRAELASLSDAALRDLGVARSELGSFEAEALPGALRTRRRVARARSVSV